MLRRLRSGVYQRTRRMLGELQGWVRGYRILMHKETRVLPRRNRRKSRVMLQALRRRIQRRGSRVLREMQGWIHGHGSFLHPPRGFDREGVLLPLETQLPQSAQMLLAEIVLRRVPGWLYGYRLHMLSRP